MQNFLHFQFFHFGFYFCGQFHKLLVQAGLNGMYKVNIRYCAMVGSPGIIKFWEIGVNLIMSKLLLNKTLAFFHPFFYMGHGNLDTLILVIYYF